MIKEIGIGLALAVVLFLSLAGYDITPLIFTGAAVVGLYFIVRSRGLLEKTFGLRGGEGSVGITFDDIGGQAAAVQELKEALDFIVRKKEIEELGIRPLKGILLTGPPGTGKTLMAKAAAAYTDAVFVAASGSEFIEVYAGVGAQRVRNLFRTARELARRQHKSNAVIFIDEIDVLGSRRGQVTSHLEYDQTLNQLLTEMDGLKTDDEVRVLVIAATNRADMLDPALLRPGRFDRQVRVDLPDREGRLEILRLHTRNKPLAADVDLGVIARETFGFSGAHLESLTNEAAILAMREGLKEISHRHFMEAIDKVIMGARLDRRPPDNELRRVAVHEVGHALISELIRPGSVSSLTVTPRGQALGYMRQVPEDDSYLQTRESIEGQIAVLLAGAVAEEMLLGSRSTGAQGDFQQAVKLVEQLIFSGMSELGTVSPECLPAGLRFRVMQRILRQQEEWVRQRLASRVEVMKKVVAELLEREKLSGDQFRHFLAA